MALGHGQSTFMTTRVVPRGRKNLGSQPACAQTAANKTKITQKNQGNLPNGGILPTTNHHP
jgi:hypothetical protein